jgi:hypothetical protein
VCLWGGVEFEHFKFWREQDMVSLEDQLKVMGVCESVYV